MKLEKYNANLNYSYVFGAFGTIELLKNKVKECLMVIVDPSFINNDAFKQIKNICKENNIEVIVDLNLISKIRDKGNIFVIGVFKKYRYPLNNNKHIILYGVNDKGVIGTIIRSMRGFDFENLVLIDCDVDEYDEHLIRSTMGAFFSTNIIKLNSLNEYKKMFVGKELFNISIKGEGNSLLDINENTTLVFSNKSIECTDIKKYSLNKDISLDNVINIILFKLY